MLKDEESGALSCGANVAAPPASIDNVEAPKIACVTHVSSWTA
jgi:hypothetical protein